MCSSPVWHKYDGVCCKPRMSFNLARRIRVCRLSVVTFNLAHLVQQIIDLWTSSRKSLGVSVYVTTYAMRCKNMFLYREFHSEKLWYEHQERHRRPQRYDAKCISKTHPLAQALRSDRGSLPP